ncbi:hypothetical protein GCM10011397_19680 [Wenyingzhuangia marina]|nr:hypothetical protein GCM10011397_19680 [Wenyingzhuangia marina]
MANMMVKGSMAYKYVKNTTPRSVNGDLFTLLNNTIKKATNSRTYINAEFVSGIETESLRLKCSFKIVMLPADNTNEKIPRILKNGVL